MTYIPNIIYIYVYISYKGVVSTIFRIVFIMFIILGFSFKTNVPISSLWIPILNKPYNIFYDIPNIEAYKGKFLHLFGMYFFMVLNSDSKLMFKFFTDKHDTKKINGKKSLERNIPIIYDFHLKHRL